MKHITTTRAFNAGYFGRRLRARSDHPKYQFGCRHIDNWLAAVQGAVRRRGGMRFVNSAAAADVRLVPFVYSAAQSYMLEFTEEKIRFYAAGGGIIVDGEEPYEVVTPFAAGELAQLQYEQSVDVLYITHPAHPVCKLSRYGHTNWVFEQLNITDGPFQDQNTTEQTMKASLPQWVAGLWQVGEYVQDEGIAYECIALTDFEDEDPPADDSEHWLAAGDTSNMLDGWVVRLETNEEEFAAGAEGRLYRLDHVRKEVAFSGEFNEEYDPDTVPVGSISEVIDVRGPWELRTHGNWGGTIQLQRKFADSTDWEPYRTYRSVYHFDSHSGDNNIAVTGEQQERCKYRLVMLAYDGEDTHGSYDNTCQWDLTVQDFVNEGVVQLIEIVNAMTAKAVVVAEIAEADETKRWRRGSWSEISGFPSVVCLWKGRLVFGGSKEEPNTIWLSRADNWHSFESDSYADSAIYFPLPESRGDVIKWLLDKRDLVVGTEGTEIVVSKLAVSEPLSAANLTSQRYSSLGSCNVRAVLAADSVLYVQRGGRRLREFDYNYERDGYVSSDKTLFADELLAGGISDVAMITLPTQQLWCTSDGNVLIYTFERGEEVSGWARLITDGTITAIAALPAAGGDEVWVVVRREIDGESHSYIESLSAAGGQPYLDSYLSLESESFVSSVSGLEHLEGQAVHIYADEAYLGSQTVSEGAVSLPKPAKNIAVGLKYDSILSPNAFDVSGQPASITGFKRRLISLIIDVAATRALKIGASPDKLETKRFMKNTLMGEAAADADESFSIVVGNGWNTEGVIYLVVDEPVGAEIISITAMIEING